MIIRQEESTPIGNCFHDSGLMKVFEKLKDTVLKTLKSVTSKAETEYQKLKSRKELRDSINNHY